MADSIVKLRIDSQEYDSKLKKASDALTRYFDNVRAGGGTLEHLDEGVMDAVKSMGKMETASTSTRGKLRELTQATADMLAQYRQLTDAERATPLGAEMASSIQELTERAGEMRDAMDDANASIMHAASDTRAFDQAAGAITGITASFQTLQGAAKLAGIELGDNVEVIAKLQAAMAVTTGLQQLQNLLQKQSALMQGVNALQMEFNLLAKANPYILLASAAAAVVGAYALWASNGNDAKKAQEALNYELDRTSDQLSKIDQETDFSVGIAEAAGKSWKAIHDLRLEAARTKLQLADMNYDKMAASGVASAEQMKKAAEMQQKAWDNVMKVLNEGTIHDVKMRNGGGSRVSGGVVSSVNKEAQSEDQRINQNINSLTNEYIHASSERRAAIELEISALQREQEEIKRLKDMALGTTFEAGELDGVVVTGNKNKQYQGNTSQNIGSYISNLNSELANADLGSAVFNSISAKLADANAYKNLMEIALNEGLSDVTISGSGIWKNIVSGEDIPDDVWESLTTKINEKLAELGIEPITVDFNTGSVSKASKDMKKDWSDTAGAIQAVGSAMSSIEDPAAKVVGTVAQAVATVALGYAKALATAADLGPWAWIAFAATGLATMITTISSIHSATGYAEGGLVKGTSYSGDNIYGGNAMVNAGELVLNRAQQGNLANQLQDSRPANMGISRVSGEQIYVALGAYLQRTGRGEMVTWK